MPPPDYAEANPSDSLPIRTRAVLSKPKNSERNRAIFAAYCSGETVDNLSERYGLRPDTLYAVILAEKHRHAFSPLPVYQEARGHAADNLLTVLTIE
jgi:hypothetical protein